MLNNNYSCIAIGNFDGIHKGHDDLIKNMIEISKKEGYRSIILTFRYSDKAMKKNPENLKYIMGFNNKIKLLKQYNVDEVDIIELNSDFKHYTPEKFISDILIKKYNMKHIFVGYNFKFGYKATGNIGTLKELSDKYSYNVFILDKVQYHGVEISSTLIRRYISEGNINEANCILKYNYTIFSNELEYINQYTCIVSKKSEILTPCDGNYPVMVGNVSCCVDIKTMSGEIVFTFSHDVVIGENVIFLDK